MRWPFGGRRRRAAAAVPASASAAAAVPAAPAVRRESGRRGGRGEWRRLAPPVLAVSPRPPILHAGLFSLPDVAGTRPLLPRPHATGGSPVPLAARPAAGAGMLVHASREARERADLSRFSAARVTETGDKSDEPLPAPAEPGRVRDVPVRVAPVVGHPASPRQLTRATDEYVGEAREPATPYRSSEWLRMVASAKPPWASDAAERIAPLPAAPKPAPGKPPRGASRPVPPAERAGLGASRRLGLRPPQPHGRERDAGGRAPAGQADPPSGGGAGTAYGKPGEGPGRARQPRHPGGHPGTGDRPPVCAPAAAVTQASGPPGQDPAAAGGDPAAAGRAAAPEVQPPAAARTGDSPGGQAQGPGAESGGSGPRPLPSAPAPSALERVQSPRSDTPPARTHRPPSGPAHPRWWRKSEPERTAAPISPPPSSPPPGGRSADAAPRAAGPGTVGDIADITRTGPGSAGRAGGRPQAAGGGLASTEPARPSRDDSAPRQPAPAPASPVGPHAPARTVAAVGVESDTTPVPPAGTTPAATAVPTVDGLTTERVPAGLASAFSALHGADVSDVPVRRGRAVSRQATRLDAAAFSHEGVVYLPDSAGSLGQAPARALLAHELTHVVQQRMLGAALPGEGSAEGRELEDQALATQRWFLGAAAPVPALAFLPSGTAAALTHAPAARQRARAADGEGVQRQPAEAALGLTAPPAGPERQDRPAPLTADAAAPAAPDASSAAGPGPEIGLAELRAQVAKLGQQRPADLDDPVELDELAAKLYWRLRTKLRLELIVDRERAGLLTDFR